ncbi:MAG: T9SS type A sorting domain-containing protein, partial [Chitinophagales bacterium]
WIECINFKDLTMLKTCEGLAVKNSISENLNAEWDIWFCEHEGKKYTIKLYNDKISPVEIALYDLSGKKIKAENFQLNEGENALSYEMPMTTSGNYILVVKSSERMKSFKLLLK